LFILNNTILFEFTPGRLDAPQTNISHTTRSFLNKFLNIFDLLEDVFDAFHADAHDANVGLVKHVDERRNAPLGDGVCMFSKCE
jgi:hypothetical protein